MGTHTLAAAEEHRESVLHALGHVVGVEDGNGGGLLQPLPAQHLDVHPRDGQDGGGPKGGGGHGSVHLGRHVVSLPARLHHIVPGQVGGQVLGHADGSNAGPAPAVGDAEGLVQVEMADVGPNGAGGGQAHLGIHVGAVHVHLSSLAVHVVNDLLHALLKHPVGGGVRDHEGSQVVGVLVCLRLEVHQVNVAVLVRVHHHHLHSSHDGTGRVGSVGGDGDEADLAVVVPVGLVVLADAKQSCVLALGTGVGLGGHRSKPRDLRQVLVQGLNQLHVPLALVGGGKGVHVADLGPGHGLHLHRGIQLHGAGPQGDHGGVEGQVLVLQGLEVAQHLGLRVVAVEHRVGHELRAAQERGARDGALGGGGHGVHVGVAAKGAEDGLDVVLVDGLPEGEPHGGLVHHAAVEPAGSQGRLHLRGRLALGAHVHGDGIKEDALGLDGVPGLLQSCLGGVGHVVDPGGDLLHALWPVVDTVGRGHVG
mmetsp:Transcript_22702/g.32923  ORF Transcript_22702/g.32923 Transcript_22702/m.32923 type:complete len:478 (-) Transcript_22702:1289-2722(-)